MKTFNAWIAGAMLLAGAGLSQASVIYTLTINLSPYHAGSTLSGSATVASPLQPGDSTNINLSFSDPGDYTPTALSTTLTAGNGINANTMRFSEIDFTNIATTMSILLNVNVAAQCSTGGATPDGVPCNANGQWRDHDPPRFTGTYTVTAETASTTGVPEPSLGLLTLAAVGGLAARKVKKTRIG